MGVRYRFLCLPLALVALLCVACRHPPPPYDVPPVLVNRDEVAEVLRRAETSVDAVVILRIMVNEQGDVVDVRVASGSGDPVLDDWAVRVGRRMRFEPAIYQNRAVRAVVEMPVTFEWAPPATRGPALENAELVARTMAREHGDLRGEAQLRLWVDCEGSVGEIEPVRASGVAVREAARALAGELRFAPALSGDTPTAAWVVVSFEFDGERSRVYVEPSRKSRGSSDGPATAASGP